MNINLENFDLKKLLKSEGYTSKSLVFEEEYQGGFYMTIPCEGYHVEIGKKSPKKISVLNVFSVIANPILDLVGVEFRVGDIADLSKLNLVNCNNPYYSIKSGCYEVSIFVENNVISCVNVENLDLISENGSSSLSKNIDSMLSMEEVFGYWKGEFLGDEKLTNADVYIIDINSDRIVFSSNNSEFDKEISYGVTSKSKGFIKLNCSRMNPLTNVQKKYKLQIKINNENCINYENIKSVRITKPNYIDLMNRIVTQRNGNAKS